MPIPDDGVIVVIVNSSTDAKKRRRAPAATTTGAITSATTTARETAPKRRRRKYSHGYVIDEDFVASDDDVAEDTLVYNRGLLEIRVFAVSVVSPCVCHARKCNQTDVFHLAASVHCIVSP